MGTLTHIVWSAILLYLSGKGWCQRCWLTQIGLLKRCFLPGLARTRANVVKEWKVLCARGRTKPSTLSQERAAGAGKNNTVTF